MSVNKNDIDLALKKSAGIMGPANQPVIKKDTQTDLQTALANSAKGIPVKKDGTDLKEPSDTPPASVVPSSSTTYTTKWDDNPLNPAKAANDFEAARDKTPEILFKEGDKQKLSELATKYNVVEPQQSIRQLKIGGNGLQKNVDEGALFETKVRTPMQTDFERSVATEDLIQGRLKQIEEQRRLPGKDEAGARMAANSKTTRDEEVKLKEDLRQAQELKRKVATELVVNGEKEIGAVIRQDNTGNLWKNLVYGDRTPGGWNPEVQKRIEDKTRNLSSQFVTGLNYLKLAEPVEFERVSEALLNGLPISQSQAANITAQGLAIEKAKLQRDIYQSPISVEEKKRFETASASLSAIMPTLKKYDEIIKSKQPLTQVQIGEYKKLYGQYESIIKTDGPLIDKVHKIEEGFAKRGAELMEVQKRILSKIQRCFGLL